jgi:hypothetical protein
LHDDKENKKQEYFSENVIKNDDWENDKENLAFNDIKFSQHLFQRMNCSSITNFNRFMLSNLFNQSRDKIISKSMLKLSSVSHDDEKERIIFSFRYIRKTMLKRKLTFFKNNLLQERWMNAAKVHKREDFACSCWWHYKHARLFSNETKIMSSRNSEIDQI